MTSLLTLIVLAFGLSVDAFAASLGKGAGEKGVGLKGALRIGLIFAGMEAVMPLVGYAIGLALATWVAGVDHWIAFILLLGVGLHLIYEAVTEGPETVEELSADTANGPFKGPRWVHLGLAAIATSIDATVVGVSLAMMDVNIFLACFVIFVVTSVVCVIGALIGGKAASWLGRWAEVLGGVVLIAIGSFILWQHLSQGI